MLRCLLLLLDLGWLNMVLILLKLRHQVLELGNAGIEQALSELKVIILILLRLLVCTIEEIASVDRRLLVYLLWLSVDEALSLPSLMDHSMILLLGSLTVGFNLQRLLYVREIILCWTARIIGVQSNGVLTCGLINVLFTGSAHITRVYVFDNIVYDIMDLRVFFDLLKLSECTNESLHREVIIFGRSSHSSVLLLFVGGCLLFADSDAFLLLLLDHLLTILALLGAL